jgi:nitrate reductase gamma subunit
VAVRFDASGDYLSRSSDVLNYQSAYTWMGWIVVKVDLNAISTIFIIDDGTTTGRDFLRLASDGLLLQMRVDNGGTGSSQDNTTLVVDTFYHVAMVRESATSCKAYLNGVLDSTNVTDITGRPASTRMNVATRNAGSNPYNGLVGYQKAWTVALSANAILSEMRSVRPRHQLNSLYAWWPSRAGATERAKDYSGNGRHWTETGTLTDEGDPPVWWGGRGGTRFYVAGGAAINFATTIAGTSSTSDIVALAIARALATTISGTSTTPDTVALSVARALSTVIAGTSLTPDTVALAIARALAATISGTSTTPDTIALSVAARFAVTISGTSTTPDDAELNVARSLSVTISGTSATPDDIDLTIPRLFAATIAGTSTTPDDSELTIARLLAATISGSSTTPDDVELALFLAFAVAIAGTSTTADDVDLAVARALAATITGTSLTPDTVTLMISMGATPWTRHTFAAAADDLTSQAKRTYPFVAQADNLTSEA